MEQNGYDQINGYDKDSAKGENLEMSCYETYYCVYFYATINNYFMNIV